ncbi:MAG TPA: fibrobacter succinogenes major paralogous domain-containing protein [Bacteroidales bacterium]|nr:fibrobacter succinogenes major paralogous domain-containing protein [Bacteroidales bacterium]
MKKNFLASSIIFIVCLMFMLSSCTSEDSLSKPIFGTTEVGIITEATATLKSMITSDRGYNITARGVCWSTSPNPTIENDTTYDAFGIGEYTSIIKDLSPSTIYYVRAYATNQFGTAYGLQATFTAKSFALTSNTPAFIMAQSAVSGGFVSSNGDSVTVIARGVCWSTSVNPTVSLTTKTVNGSGIGSFSSIMKDLMADTKYYVRAYVTNSVGTTYGNELNFTTQNGIVILTTAAATAETSTSATLGGNISNDGGAPVTERGVCWSTSINPTISLSTKTVNGSGAGSFTSFLTGLQSGTTYYVRAYATNSVGTTYGDEKSFSTRLLSGTLTDIDGNLYHFITIGTQTWMVENLRTTKYRDGTSIPNVTEATQWRVLTTGAYCDYNNAVGNSTTYGRLYNWYAVSNSPSIAPTGWHVPTDAEWATLTTYLGGMNVAGGKLKEAGTAHWVGSNTGSTNESGFSALPGGCRNRDDWTFGGIGYEGFWWCISEDSATSDAWFRHMSYQGNLVFRLYSTKSFGFSVRCVRD